MVYSDHLPKSERAGLLVGIAAIHLGLLILVMNLRQMPHAVAPRNGPLSVEMLAADAQPQKPVPAVLPAKRPLPSEAKSISIPSFAPPAPSNSGTGDCPILDALQKAIVASPEAQAAVDGLPIQERSLSDATVIWSAGWTEVADAPDAPLAAVRNAMVQALATVDSRCLDEQVAGPRLIAIASANETRLLVIGSGTWSWQQLAAQGPLATGTPFEPAPPAVGATNLNRQNNRNENIGYGRPPIVL